MSGRLEPHKLTKADMAKGGRNAAVKKLQNKLLADKMLGYFTGDAPYDQGNDFVSDFMSLEPKERLQFTASVLKFIMPTLHSSSIDAVMDISGRVEISVEERREKIKELLTKAS